MIDKNYRRVKNISKELEEYYVEYFRRNTTKFFWKWGYKDTDLGSIFIKENEEYSLLGQVNETTFLMKRLDDESRFFVSGDFLKDQFKGKENV
jgi:hypothetical protein